MGHESASRAVRGLSIATIVLSILGIILALGIGACSSIFTNVVEDELVGSSSVESSTVRLTAAHFSDAVDEVEDLYDELGSGVASEFCNLLACCDAKDVHKLGKAIAEGDFASIQKTIDVILGEDSDLVDSAFLARHLAMLDSDDAAELGYALQQVTDDDIADLIDALDFAMGFYLDDDYFADDFEDEFENEFGYGASEVVNSASRLIAVVIWILVVLEILGCAVTLVASILSLRNANNPDKLTGAFVWSIVGACIALLSCRIITMILLIITCVYIHKVRAFRLQPGAAAAAAAPAGEPAAEQPFGYGAPIPPEE